MFRTILAAFCVGTAYKIDVEKIIEALESFEFPPGRMTKIEGVKNTIIIDSSYNSSPPAMIGTFQFSAFQ